MKKLAINLCSLVAFGLYLLVAFASSMPEDAFSYEELDVETMLNFEDGSLSITYNEVSEISFENLTVVLYPNAENNSDGILEYYTYNDNDFTFSPGETLYLDLEQFTDSNNAIYPVDDYPYRLVVSIGNFTIRQHIVDF